MVEKQPETDSLPAKITIVTPSLNQTAYLEDTICSIIGQNYPNLEYMIMDGGSNEETLNIIRKYEKHLSYWISEPDNGMYDALNKGFAHSTGEIMGWLNSDDKYLPWTLAVVGKVFSDLPEVQWITTHYPMLCFNNGQYYNARIPGFSRIGFYKGEYLPTRSWFSVGAFIQQESTFWRRSLWEQAGGHIDTKYQLAADFELWARFYKHADLYGIPSPLAAFRVHQEQKSANYLERYFGEAEQALTSHQGGSHKPLTSFLRRHIASRVIKPFKKLAIRSQILLEGKSCHYIAWLNRWEIAPTEYY